MLGNRTSLKADAILFATSKIGVMAIECIASLGLKISDDVALVSFDNANACALADGGSLVLHGGSAWEIGAKSISFVQATKALYDGNSVNAAITAFAAGTATADPIFPYYVFKIVNGANPTVVYNGMIQIVSTVPGISVAFEYRVGNQYAYLSVVQ